MSPLVPTAGATEDDIVQFVLDETAARAVFRAKGDPGLLKITIDAPFTALGSVVCGALGEENLAEEYTLNRDWQSAVQALHNFVRTNAERICQEFAGKESPWPEAFE